MTHFFKQNFQFVAILAMAFLVGCDSDNTDVIETDTIDPPSEVSTIRFTEGGSIDDKATASVSGVAGETAEARVIFTTTDSKQRRLYVTQTLPGEGAMPFVVPGLTNKGTKADGSIDLDADVTKTLDFTFDLNVPSDVSDGSIEYHFWTTTGKGDFRDDTKRQLLGVGVITVSVGDGTNPDAVVSSYSGIQLAAPAADGTSSSFFSLLNGQMYKISEGIEYASFWDFGYFHLDSTGANLASTSDYNPNVVDVATKSGTPIEELNKTYFKMASGVDFDAVSIANDLSSLSVSTADPETISGLAVGDIVEFIDQYDKKGLIRVVAVEPGFSPTQDYITIDIKVQP